MLKSYQPLLHHTAFSKVNASFFTLSISSLDKAEFLKTLILYIHRPSWLSIIFSPIHSHSKKVIFFLKPYFLLHYNATTL